MQHDLRFQIWCMYMVCTCYNKYNSQFQFDDAIFLAKYHFNILSNWIFKNKQKIPWGLYHLNSIFQSSSLSWPLYLFSTIFSSLWQTSPSKKKESFEVTLKIDKSYDLIPKQKVSAKRTAIDDVIFSVYSCAYLHHRHM